ncbi:MAG TPA: QueT transporter family protein [Coriobacteriia bacterium]|nr:QueT transporter family protein [Coriobacteriia bacterium]
MNRARYIAQAGMIAAAYAAATLLTLYLPFSLGFGLIQFRLSEAVTVLAMFTPAAIPGLTLGSVIANALNPQATWPFAFLDVVFGSVATMLGALWMWNFRDRTRLALAGPVIANALIVPAYLPVMLEAFGLLGLYNFLGVNVEGSWFTMYLVGVVAVGIGEALVVYTLGWGLLEALRRLGLAEVLSRRS